MRSTTRAILSETEVHFYQLIAVLAALAEIEDRYAGDVLTDILRMPVAKSSNGEAETGQRNSTEAICKS